VYNSVGPEGTNKITQKLILDEVGETGATTDESLVKVVEDLVVRRG